MRRLRAGKRPTDRLLPVGTRCLQYIAETESPAGVCVYLTIAESGGGLTITVERDLVSGHG